MYSFKFILFCWEIYATDKKFLNLNPTNSIQSDLNKLLKMLKWKQIFLSLDFIYFIIKKRIVISQFHIWWTSNYKKTKETKSLK